MKALMLVIILGSGIQQYPDGGFAIWFKNIDTCKAAKVQVQKSLPQSYASRWTKVVCIEVEQ